MAEAAPVGSPVNAVRAKADEKKEEEPKKEEEAKAEEPKKEEGAKAEEPKKEEEVKPAPAGRQGSKAWSSGQKDALLKAAEALKGTTVSVESGLVGVLERLASAPTPPADVTTWLCMQLQGLRPTTVSDYPEPVLKDLVMKSDEFANIHLLKSERPHPEVWNFRKTETEGLPVFGSGQCHLKGIEFLGKHLKEQGFEKALWFNMREEPVVFLDGQVTAPRSSDNMNENVEHLTSIEGYELDSMEKRLRDDCVQAAEAADGKTIGVFFQLADGSNEERQLPATLDKSLPVREAYDWLNKQDGVLPIAYHRVPIADETAPEEKDFDQLIRELKDIACKGAKDGKTAMVFNCQMGRGRTTTGMVCGSIMLLAAGWKTPEGTAKLPAPSSEERNLKRGEFADVLKLLGLVDTAAQSKKAAAKGIATEGRGLAAKSLTDKCCDDCAHAQNMVEAIIECTESAKKAEPGGSRPPEFWARRAHSYLQRYAYILLFAAYALEEVHGGFETSFTEWSHRHWQFKRIIKHITLK